MQMKLLFSEFGAIRSQPLCCIGRLYESPAGSLSEPDHGEAALIPAQPTACIVPAKDLRPSR